MTPLEDPKIQSSLKLLEHAPIIGVAVAALILASVYAFKIWFKKKQILEKVTGDSQSAGVLGRTPLLSSRIIP